MRAVENQYSAVPTRRACADRRVPMEAVKTWNGFVVSEPQDDGSISARCLRACAVARSYKHTRVRQAATGLAAEAKAKRCGNRTAAEGKRPIVVRSLVSPS